MCPAFLTRCKFIYVLEICSIMLVYWEFCCQTMQYKYVTHFKISLLMFSVLFFIFPAAVFNYVLCFFYVNIFFLCLKTVNNCLVCIPSLYLYVLASYICCENIFLSYSIYFTLIFYLK